MTQAQAVIETIEMLGGIATLNQINQNIFKIEDCQWRTKTPFASVRRIVQQTSGIYKIKPGLYTLESHRQELEGNGLRLVVWNRQQQNCWRRCNCKARITKPTFVGFFVPFDSLIR